MQLPPLPIPNNFQYLEEQYWQVYDSVSNTFRIYTALDNVQLATGSAGSGEIDVLYDAAQAALEVWADTITLNGTLTLPGQNVTIIARVIQLTADAEFQSHVAIVKMHPRKPSREAETPPIPRKDADAR